MTTYLGIDLGTTYTAAAVHDGGPGRGPEVVPLGDRGPSVPSVLYLQPDGSFLAGDAAERHAVTDPQSIARQFKRRLGDPTPLLVGGTGLPAEVLTGHLLRFVVETVVRARGGERPAKIVLTHPANWGPFKPRAARALGRARRGAGRRAGHRAPGGGDLVLVAVPGRAGRGGGGLRPRRRHVRRCGAAQGERRGVHDPRHARGDRAPGRHRRRRRGFRPGRVGRGRRVRAARPRRRRRAVGGGPVAAGLHPGQGSAVARLGDHGPRAAADGPDRGEDHPGRARVDDPPHAERDGHGHGAGRALGRPDAGPGRPRAAGGRFVPHPAGRRARVERPRPPGGGRRPPQARGRPRRRHRGRPGGRRPGPRRRPAPAAPGPRGPTATPAPPGPPGAGPRPGPEPGPPGPAVLRRRGGRHRGRRRRRRQLRPDRRPRPAARTTGERPARRRAGAGCALGRRTTGRPRRPAPVRLGRHRHAGTPRTRPARSRLRRRPARPARPFTRTSTPTRPGRIRLRREPAPQPRPAEPGAARHPGGRAVVRPDPVATPAARRRARRVRPTPGRGAVVVLAAGARHPPRADGRTVRPPPPATTPRSRGPAATPLCPRSGSTGPRRRARPARRRPSCRPGT